MTAMLGARETLAVPVVGGCIAEVGGFNNPSCTANDVALTAIVEGSLQILDDGCTSNTDTVTFTAQGIFELTTNERFDIGVYIATDGDPDGSGAKMGTCARDSLATTPDPPYVSIDDPADACGDIDAAHSPLTQLPSSPIGPVTILCVDKDGDDLVDIDSHTNRYPDRYAHSDPDGHADRDGNSRNHRIPDLPDRWVLVFACGHREGCRQPNG